jgi:CBS domain-containing membrane protein
MDTMGARRPRRHHAKRLGYPHRLQASKTAGEDMQRLHRSDISQALADLGEAFDVSAEDLEILLERAEHYATLRAGPSVKGANPI